MSGSWLRSMLPGVSPGIAVVSILLWEDRIGPGTALILTAAILTGVGITVRRRLATENAVLTRLNRLTAEAQTQLDTLSFKAAVADQIIASMPDPLFFLDRDRRVVRSNPEADALVNTNLIGRDIADGLRDPQLLLAIDRVIEGAEHQTVDLKVPVPVEAEFIARIAPIVAPPDAGKERDVPVVLVDLQNITALRRSEQMRVDFVANVSHELRTPLTSLTGFIETLRGPARGDMEAQDKFLAIMQEQSERMFRLISDLLSLSHIKLDEHSRPKDSVDLVSLLHRMTEMLSQKAENAGLVVNMQIEDSLPAVLGDEDQLFQVFQNLLENALKYGANGDHVDIVAKMSGPNRMTIDVIDYGPGIPDDHIPRLTERFYRVDTARSRELGGTGLGLAIVKHILNRHRGRLSITSTVGKGSCFSVSLETVHPS